MFNEKHPRLDSQPGIPSFICSSAVLFLERCPFSQIFFHSSLIPLVSRCSKGAEAAGRQGGHFADAGWKQGGSADVALLPARRHVISGGEPDDTVEPGRLFGTVTLPSQHTEERYAVAKVHCPCWLMVFYAFLNLWRINWVVLDSAKCTNVNLILKTD